MQQILARKNVQKTKFEAAEMIVDPWNQRVFIGLEISNSASMESIAQGASAWGTKRPYIRALHAKKATAMRPDAIFFLLQCGANPPNYGLTLSCFSLSCNPGAISLIRVAFYMESENHAVWSPLLRLLGIAFMPGHAHCTVFRKRRA